MAEYFFALANKLCRSDTIVCILHYTLPARMLVVFAPEAIVDDEFAIVDFRWCCSDNRGCGSATMPYRYLIS